MTEKPIVHSHVLPKTIRTPEYQATLQKADDDYLCASGCNQTIKEGTNHYVVTGVAPGINILHINHVHTYCVEEYLGMKR